MRYVLFSYDNGCHFEDFIKTFLVAIMKLIRFKLKNINYLRFIAFPCIVFYCLKVSEIVFSNMLSAMIHYHKAATITTMPLCSVTNNKCKIPLNELYFTPKIRQNDLFFLLKIYIIK